MPTRLILLAQGETDAVRRAAFPGDEGLSLRGRDAAAGRRATLPRLDHASTSPAAAARQTAAALDLDAGVDESLRDLDIGIWRGRTLADVAATDPVAAAAWIAEPDFDAHGGESVARLIARMGRWLPAARSRTGVTLAVTHAAVLRASVVALLQAPAPAFWLVDAGPLSALTLTSDGRRWAVRSLDGAPATS